MGKRTALTELLLLAVCLAWPQQAQARRFFRARFEPDTLENQDAGNLEIDVQVGGTYGDGVDGSRLVLPDLDLELGLTDWLEIDIDAAFSLTQLGEEPGPGGDPLWTSLRLEALNLEDDRGRNFGIGVQLGPRFRTIDNAKGVGVGSLLLVGGGTKTLHAVLNFGAFADREQAVAFAYGANLEYEFEKRRKWSLQWQLAGAHYFGSVHGDTDQDQIFFLAGFGTELRDDLQLGLMALCGPFHKGDRVGLMADVTWDHKLW